MSINYQAINTGDELALICTGSSCLPEDPKIARQYLLDQYQLKAHYREDTHARISTQQRADIFLETLFDDRFNLLWLLRGGEGSADLVPYVAQQHARIAGMQPKMLVGFSDFTPLLNYFAQQFGWQTVHGPGALQLAKNKIDQSSEQAIIDLVFGRRTRFHLNSLVPLNEVAEQQQTIEAPVVGGTLSLINISVSDAWQIDARDKIVILEDVNEKAHKVSRTLKYLKRIGMFDGAAAIILGDFTAGLIGCSHEEQRTNIAAINRSLKWFAGQCEFPVLVTREFGHGKQNHPIVLNRPARLTLGHTGSVSF